MCMILAPRLQECKLWIPKILFLDFALQRTSSLSYERRRFLNDIIDIFVFLLRTVAEKVTCRIYVSGDQLRIPQSGKHTLSAFRSFPLHLKHFR